jgi:hypothetical protein
MTKPSCRVSEAELCERGGEVLAYGSCELGCWKFVSGLRAIRKQFAGECGGGERFVSCVLLVSRHGRDLDEARRAERELANDSDSKRRSVKAVIGISNTREWI